MHLSRIAIEGFRNFSALDLEDLPPAMVIVGENGTGKSNLLHALRLVLDPSLPDTARQLTAEDFWDGLPAPFDGNEITITVELADFDDDQAAMALLYDHLVNTSPNVARLTYVYRPRPLATSESSEADYEPILYGGERDDRRVGREVLRYVSLRVLPALRDAETDLGSPRSPLRRLLARVQLDETLVQQISAGITAATDALLADDGVAEINTGITDRLAEMVGDVFAVATTLGIAPTEADQLTRSIRLFINEAKQRGVGQVSLGTANLLYLALLLEHIGAQEAAEEIVTTILAVEEPEAHLHPHLQRVLFRHLFNNGRALLVTTHSPHLASVAPLSSLTLLRDVGGETQAFHTRDLGLDTRTEADLQRYMDVTRAEILFAKAVILVEGVAEQFLLPAFATANGFDLDAHGVTICAVHGTDFVPYTTLLGSDGLDIPHVVITDGDPTDTGTLRGTTRGMRLVGAPTRARVKGAVAADDISAALRALRKGNVFVGNTTLELDLLPAAHKAMLIAHEELVRSSARQTNFASDLDVHVAGDEARGGAILDRLTKLGKGRFAQRLSAHLEDVTPPAYIAKALARIEDMVQRDD